MLSLWTEEMSKMTIKWNHKQCLILLQWLRTTTKSSRVTTTMTVITGSFYPKHDIEELLSQAPTLARFTDVKVENAQRFGLVLNAVSIVNKQFLFPNFKESNNRTISAKSKSSYQHQHHYLPYDYHMIIWWYHTIAVKWTLDSNENPLFLRCQISWIKNNQVHFQTNY